MLALFVACIIVCRGIIRHTNLYCLINIIGVFNKSFAVGCLGVFIDNIYIFADNYPFGLFFFGICYIGIIGIFCINVCNICILCGIGIICLFCICLFRIRCGICCSIFCGCRVEIVYRCGKGRHCRFCRRLRIFNRTQCSR